MHSEGNNIYSYEFTSTNTYDYVIFSNNGNSQTAGDGAVALNNGHLYNNSGDQGVYNPVKAWDFNGNAKPSELKVVFTSMFSGDAATKELQHQGGTNGWMTNTEFEAPADGTFSFYLYAKNDEGTWENIRGSQNETTFNESNWVSVDAITTDGSSTFSQRGIVKGATYKLAVKGNGDNKFQWNFTKIADPTPTYPAEVEMVKAGGTIATASSADGVYTFSGLSLDAYTWFYFKTSDGSGYYCPENNTEIPVENSAVKTLTNEGNKWNNPEAGTYTIVLDLKNNTLTATKTGGGDTYPTLYLYQDRSNNWSDKAAGQASSTDGKYTFSVDLEKDGIFVICTDPDGITGWSFNSNTKLYGTDDSSADVPVGAVDDCTSFKERGLSGNDGLYGWKATKTGRYTIEVDIPGESLDITGFTEPVVIDPVDPADTKTIYFDNSSSKWASVRAYIYTNDSNRLTDWGGAPAMTPIGNNIYSYTFSGDYKYVIFYNGSNDANKTGDNVDVIDGHVYKSDSSHKVYDPEDYKVKLYMYTGANNWVGSPKASCEESANGTYTFTVSLNSGDFFAFSSKSTSSGYSASIEMTPGGDVNVGGSGNAVTTEFKSSNTGAWCASATGTYKLRINSNTGKLKVLSSPAVAAAAVRLPLTSADFADGKKHYFLVGDRLGEWKLQPEWELKDNGDGTYALSNRFIYNTDFAVAVVDNFEDYSNHCYRWYSSNTTLSGSNVTSFTSNGVNERYAGETQYNGSDKFHANWDSDYWQGGGAFMSQIKLTVNGSGVPSRLDFTQGTMAQKTRNRMYTLVGAGFYNNRFNNEVYNGVAGNVRTYRSNLNNSKVGDNNAEKAWQDSWIQYNPQNRRPYVDANNEYLYHTSYTPDYLQANPVYFNRTLSDGSEFPFTSSSIQFVDYENLDPENDPYWDFYQSISNKETIKNNGASKSGGDGDTKYDYKLYTAYNGGANDAGQTPTGDWHCLVVKDMWVEGEFKFWSGWGGSTRRTKGTKDNEGGKSATWNGPNGGPNSSGTSEIEGFDVKEGGDVTLYKNKRNVDKENFKTKGGDMVYFDRVVIWYNEEGEVSQSFIQFIQQNAGPAIYAQNSVAATDGADNYIKYSWYIQKPTDETQATEQGKRRVVGYKIHRYQRTEDGNIDLGYAEGSANSYVNIANQQLTVADFYRDAAKRPDYTKNHLDKGQGGRGFNPGVYYYTVDVYYEADGSVHKYATSNEVPIYADELVTPEAMAYQIIEFTDADAPKAALGTTGQKYMTYSPVAGTPIYAFDIVNEKVDVNKDGKTETVDVEIPANVKALTRATAVNYLRNNPDKTLWTSDFYVRCLDEDDYKDALNAYKDNGMLLDEVLPTPTVKLSQLALDAEEGAEYIEKGYAGPFHLNNNNYYSAIMRRGGNLTDVAIKVDLSYDYTEFELDGDGNPSSRTVHATSDASSEIYPVMPMPYGVKYRYNVTRPERNLGHPNVEEGYKYGRIAVPVDNENSVNINQLKNKKDDVYVRLDANFDPRSLDLEVDFNRPNVKDDIYKWYDIQYEVNIDNNEEEVPLDVTATLHDKKYESGDYGKRYRMEIHGLHPLNDVFPTVKFVKTNYVARTLTDAEMTTRPEGYFESKEASFGDTLKVVCAQNIQVNAASIGKLRLGYIENQEVPGTYDWMYKGHDDFNDVSEVLKPATENTINEDQNDVEIKPRYYLYQVKHPVTGALLNTYEYLVPHIDDHKGGNTNFHPGAHIAIDLNDNDPLIGAYIAKGLDTGMKGKEPVTPDVYITAIYVFERPVAGMSADIAAEGDIVEGLNGLEVESFSFNRPGKVNLKNGPARAREEFSSDGNWTNEDYDKFAAGAYAELPSTNRDADGKIQLPANAHSELDMNAKDNDIDYNRYYAVRGATVKVSGGDFVVTGVDDIVTDGAYDGEAVYYNLQGIRIENPSAPGVYIKVEGRKTTKVVIE